jgi:hypothetical protein
MRTRQELRAEAIRNTPPRPDGSQDQDEVIRYIKEHSVPPNIERAHHRWAVDVFNEGCDINPAEADGLPFQYCFEGFDAEPFKDDKIVLGNDRTFMLEETATPKYTTAEAQRAMTNGRHVMKKAEFRLHKAVKHQEWATIKQIMEGPDADISQGRFLRETGNIQPRPPQLPFNPDDDQPDTRPHA